MPYRVHFVGFGQFSLDIEIVCYFATKSVDEFLSLQQVANIEILKAINGCGAMLALPTTVMMSSGPIPLPTAEITANSTSITSMDAEDDAAVATASNIYGSGVILSPPMAMPVVQHSQVVAQPLPQPQQIPSTPSVSSAAAAAAAASAMMGSRSNTFSKIGSSTNTRSISSATASSASSATPSPATIDLDAIARASQVLSTNAPTMRSMSQQMLSGELTSTLVGRTASVKSLSSASPAPIANKHANQPIATTDCGDDSIVTMSKGIAYRPHQVKNIYSLGNRKVSPTKAVKSLDTSGQQQQQQQQ